MSDGPRRQSRGSHKGPSLQVICLGSSGGPGEDSATGFLVRSTASNWAKGSILAVDAGTHLSSIVRILEKDFPLVADPAPSTPPEAPQLDQTSPRGPRHVLLQRSGSIAESEGTSTRSSTPEPPLTTLTSGPFAGLPFPCASARANAVHVVRDYVSTYLITHPHLDHLAGFVINTAAFHNTSRPKRLAALPFTVNAIKTHLFNDVIWPNLTDEDGGVGFVTFQRLAEGGNIALGMGRGSGYIEVCDGLEVRGFKVSHGHCMKGPGHVHRGSGSAQPAGGLPVETPRRQSQAFQLDPTAGASNGHGRSHSISALSQPGTPRHGSGAGVGECTVDSSAYFIRAEATGKEILVFGDVEPDALSLSPRNAAVWAEAAPKIAAGILAGVFIECSYSDAQGDAVLFGHLAPRHLVAELKVLAEMVAEAREAREREQRERSARRKRKRTGNGMSVGEVGTPTPDERRRRSEGWGMQHGQPGQTHHGSPGQHQHLGIFADTEAKRAQPAAARPVSASPNADAAADAAANGSGAKEPSTSPTTALTAPAGHALTPAVSAPAAAPAAPADRAEKESEAERLKEKRDPPLAGLKVVIIHVKDTLTDGPLVGERILAQLREHEARLVEEEGRALGCEYEISKSGASYWF